MDEPTPAVNTDMPKQGNDSEAEPLRNRRTALIALATAALAVLGWYSDIRPKALVAGCDIAAIIGQAEKFSACQDPTLTIDGLLKRIQALEKITSPLDPNLQAQLQTLKQQLAGQVAEQIIADAAKANIVLDNQAENTTAQAIRDVVVEGDSEERQALGLIAKGQIQAGLSKLRERANQAEQDNVQRWRRIGEIAYLVDTRQATLAYEKLQALDAMSTWDSIYLGRLYQRGGSLAKALAVLQAARRQLPASQRRDIGVLHNETGDILQDQGDAPAALESYRSAMTIAQQLAASDPSNSGWQR
ncbi:hypothetical protein A9Q90_03225, partial [Gammaproteobacteria bacterium 54_18_T64]